MDKIGNVTVRKRSNGKYEYRFEIEPLDGKRRWKTKGGYARKKEAQDAGYKARQEYIETGGRPERKRENISVQALSEIWIEKVLAKREATTYESYESLMRNHILSQIGKMPVKDVDVIDIENMLQVMADNGSAKSSMESVKTIASGMFSYAKKKLGLITENPVRDAEIPEAGKKKRERIPYTADQMSVLLEQAPEGSDYYMPLILGIHCGLRVSEILGLTWDRVDLKAGTITIDRQLKFVTVNHKSYHSLKKLKNENSYRTIKINNFMKNELLKERQRQEGYVKRYGPYYAYNVIKTVVIKTGKELDYVTSVNTPVVGAKTLDLVCRRQDGRFINVGSLASFLRRRSGKIGFKADTHTARHTHATIAVEGGAKIPAVAERLGQSSLSVTLQYIHNTDRMENEALEAFNKALSDAK